VAPQVDLGASQQVLALLLLDSVAPLEAPVLVSVVHPVDSLLLDLEVEVHPLDLEVEVHPLDLVETRVVAPVVSVEML